MSDIEHPSCQMSVITATSASALAIQATSSGAGMYWLVTAFYSIAFGLSLQGLILITYITIAAGGSSDEAIGRLARGEIIPGSRYNVVKLIAFVMALPAILATYSSIFLLAGLVVMVFSGRGEDVELRGREYVLMTMIPVGIASLSICVAIVLLEVGSWVEIRHRKRLQEQYKDSKPPLETGSFRVACCHCCSETRCTSGCDITVCSSRTSITVCC
jgi:hypothetical protein